MGLLDFLFIKEETTPTDGATNTDNTEFKPMEKQQENIDFFMKPTLICINLLVRMVLWKEYLYNP